MLIRFLMHEMIGKVYPLRPFRFLHEVLVMVDQIQYLLGEVCQRRWSRARKQFDFFKLRAVHRLGSDLGVELLGADASILGWNIEPIAYKCFVHIRTTLHSFLCLSNIDHNSNYIVNMLAANATHAELDALITSFQSPPKC